ncbi:response regulator [Chitinophaga horti]|uniref:Response regulator n=1 Tax=Chitinophaga horti TaxID=2920382 RepID=A0ABY6J7X8_9BACT|nr:response regulator [Chitinophaga horti]UYQ95743.1 response regulator [Chitinophaga horti]
MKHSEQPYLIVIDNDEDDHKAIRECFAQSSPGNAIKSFYDGPDALVYLSTCKTDCLPRLILLDFNMPKLTGIEVMENIRLMPHMAGVPIAMWTSSMSPEHRRLAAERGVVAYYTKPYSHAELTQLVEELQQYISMQK